MKINNFTTFILLLVIGTLLTVYLSSCSSTTDKSPQKVTVAELKDLIYSDSNHYRVVYLYNSLCNSCEEQLQHYAARYLKGNNRDIHHYIVALQPNRWKFHSDTIMSFVMDKNVHLLAIEDTNVKFTKVDEKYPVNIMTYLLQDPTLTLHDGTPQSLIISNDNIFLHSTYYTDGKTIVTPCEISDVADYNISELDFRNNSL